MRWPGCPAIPLVAQIPRRSDRWSQLLLQSHPIQKRICELAERHLDSPHREVRNLATALFEHNDRLFTFLEKEGSSPPTTAWSAPFALACNGARSVSAAAAPMANCYFALADRRRNLRPSTPQHSGLSLRSDCLLSPPSTRRLPPAPIGPTELLPEFLCSP